jgi:hypothetical protein
MPFEPSLWDDSDPLYAPLMDRVKDRYAWRASARYVALGVSGTRIYLPGKVGDGQDAERAAECRRLTRQMLASIGEEPNFPTGTWAHVILRYRHDRYSPMRDVKENTRAGYEQSLALLMPIIGQTPIRGLNYTALRAMHERMVARGWSPDKIKRTFTMLRAVAKYGKQIGIPGAREVKDILSDMRIKAPAKRQIAPTREQVRAIIAEADARGLHSFALGVLIQWTFALRGVDVFGQWLERAGEGGIRRDGMVWCDGLTWDMIAPDLSGFSKVISKTERSLPEPMHFSLAGLTEIQTRLRLIGGSTRIGPVILSERYGLPYTTASRGRTWSRLRQSLKLPAIWLMDTRAGAITEGRQLGASVTDLRDAAGHATTATTQRYMRGREEAVGKVVKLRLANGGGTLQSTAVPPDADASR